MLVLSRTRCLQKRENRDISLVFLARDCPCDRFKSLRCPRALSDPGKPSGRQLCGFTGVFATAARGLRCLDNRQEFSSTKGAIDMPAQVTCRNSGKQSEPKKILKICRTVARQVNKAARQHSLHIVKVTLKFHSQRWTRIRFVKLWAERSLILKPIRGTKFLTFKTSVAK